MKFRVRPIKVSRHAKIGVFARRRKGCSAMKNHQPNTSPSLKEHDAANNALGFRFVRALAVEKAVLDPRLAPREVRVLAAIAHHMNATTMRAWPSYRKISEIVGYADEVIERAIKNLVLYDYIFREPNRRAPYPGARAMVHYGLKAVSFDDIELVIAAAVAQIQKNEECKSGHARLIPTRKSGLGSALTPIKKLGSTSDPAQKIAADPDILVVRNPDEEPGQESGCVGSRFAADGLFKGFESLHLAWTQERATGPDRRQLIENLFQRELGAAAATHDVEMEIVVAAAAAAMISVTADLVDGRIRSKTSASLLRYFHSVLDGEIMRLKLARAAFKASVRSEHLVQEERHTKRMQGVARPQPHAPPSFDESFARVMREAP